MNNNDLIEKTTSKSTIIPFLFLSTFMIFGTVILSGIGDRNNIMENWNENRCNAGIMFAASLFKPASDSRTSGEFASDNFKFCMKNLQKNTLAATFKPAMNMMKTQMSASSTIQKTQDSLKITMNNMINDSVGKVLKSFYEKFEVFVYNIARINERLSSAFHRIEGSLQASVYAGISMMKAILNGIDFVILVVLIILAILVALVIILFLFMFPLIPVILITIAALVSVGIGVGGMASAFCFDENTEISMMNGLVKIKDITIGDKLSNHGIVEGIYKFIADDIQLYDLCGIKVSGNHFVKYNDKWVQVKNIPNLNIATNISNEIYCLTVSNREIPIQSINNILLFKDWEELDSNDDKSYSLWNNMVNEYLNGVGYESKAPLQPNTMSGNINVYLKNGYEVNIKNIKLNDFILDENNTYTRVIGVYKEMTDGSDNTEWLNDGIWLKEGLIWKHPNIIEIGLKQLGYNIITESGTFYIKYNNKNELIRDAMEVNYMDMDKLYNFLEERININD